MSLSLPFARQFDYPARRYALILIKMSNIINGHILLMAAFYREKSAGFFRQEIWTAARWQRDCSHLVLPRHLKLTQHEIIMPLFLDICIN
jgi:hypothetical protein